MGLMTQNTSFSKLQSKYRDFGAPTLRIFADGIEITQKLDANISEFSIDLTVGFDASGCQFDVIDEYQPANTAFSSKGAARLLQLGAKIEVELGYIETVCVFRGLIVEVEYILDEEGSRIHVECMDAKCLLMKQQRLELLLGQSMTSAVGNMLDRQPFSDYISGKKLEHNSKEFDMFSPVPETDYQFAVRCAQYLGYEFFILEGTAYYRAPPSSSSSILTLSPQNGLLGIRLSLRGAGLFKRAKVVGINPENDKPVSGESSVSGTFSQGSTASCMLGGTEKIQFDPLVKSAEDAGIRAKVMMDNARREFGRVYCRCIGLPELVPGRSVSVQGVSPQADSRYYILNVRHTLDIQGFFTELEGRLESL